MVTVIITVLAAGMFRSPFFLLRTGGTHHRFHLPHRNMGSSFLLPGLLHCSPFMVSGGFWSHPHVKPGCHCWTNAYIDWEVGCRNRIIYWCFYVESKRWTACGHPNLMEEDFKSAILTKCQPLGSYKCITPATCGGMSSALQPIPKLTMDSWPHSVSISLAPAKRQCSLLEEGYWKDETGRKYPKAKSL